MYEHRILAHRGLWHDSLAPNSPQAIEAAFSKGFGVEIDLQHFLGQLVLSHDVPITRTFVADSFFSLLGKCDADALCALNIKSDGLIPWLIEHKGALERVDYFFFDMSIPETVKYVRQGLRVALRVSDLEPLAGQQTLREWSGATTIWLDGLHSDWWLQENPAELHPLGSRLVLVSPDLHGRQTDVAWDRFIEMLHAGEEVHMCTDRPEELYRLMNG